MGREFLNRKKSEVVTKKKEKKSEIVGRNESGSFSFEWIKAKRHVVQTYYTLLLLSTEKHVTEPKVSHVEQYLATSQKTTRRVLFSHHVDSFFSFVFPLNSHFSY